MKLPIHHVELISSSLIDFRSDGGKNYGARLRLREDENAQNIDNVIFISGGRFINFKPATTFPYLVKSEIELKDALDIISQHIHHSWSFCGGWDDGVKFSSLVEFFESLNYLDDEDLRNMYYFANEVDAVTFKMML